MQGQVEQYKNGSTSLYHYGADNQPTGNDDWVDENGPIPGYYHRDLSVSHYPSFRDKFLGRDSVCCKDPDRDVSIPVREWSEEDREKLFMSVL